jgi:hypothetical protein
MVKKFADPAGLVAWLEEIGIDSHPWGTGPYKSMTNLWDEYKAGEISFEDDPPMRIVELVQIHVQQDGAFLFEVEQQFSTGERRFRNQPPAEKIKRGETSIDAAYRCLQEELRLKREQVEEISLADEQNKKVTDSPSYPGLPTQYRIHEIRARVTGLPAEDFWRENLAASEGDPIVRHLWSWREQE